MEAEASVSYQLKRIKCGKKRCRCNTTDESEWHGPYWYAFWQDPRTGRTKSRYMGKNYKAPGHTTGARSRYQTPPPPPPPRAKKTTKKKTEQGKRRREQAPPPPPPGGGRQERREAPPPPRGLGGVGSPQDQADAATLGVKTDVDRAALKRAWRAKIAAAHPDKGGNTAQAQAINAAYERMLKRRAWTR